MRMPTRIRRPRPGSPLRCDRNVTVHARKVWMLPRSEPSSAANGPPPADVRALALRVTS